MRLLAFTLFLAGTSVAQVSSGFQTARWIAAGPDTAASSNNQTESLPIFRRSFNLTHKPLAATLRISGLGQYEARLNGRLVTDAVLTPGWTLYSRHVFFNTYEVTTLLKPGRNVLAVLLGNGMYNVLPDPGRYSKFEGSFGRPKLIAELAVRFADGSSQTIASDATWKVARGPITFSHAYGGEDFDSRLERPGWDLPSFNAARWTSAFQVAGPAGMLIPETIPPVKLSGTFAPLAVTHPKPGLTVYDLGQNFAGWPFLSVKGPAGATVKLICGELLLPDGTVTQRSAGAGLADPTVFTYTLRGQSGTEHWHPRFSYYGFRYVQAETSSPAIRIQQLRGRALHLTVAKVGTFTSSDPLLNGIHALIGRAIDSNLLSVITDCPHREKLGWLEQTHLNGFSLMYNYDLSALYSKIAVDMADSQDPSGLVPDIAPEYTRFSGAFRDSPEWGSAVILSPWIAFEFSGDLESLRSGYPPMTRYAAYLASRAKDHLLDYGLGDWYDIGPGEPGLSKLTSAGLVPSAIYFQDLTTLAEIASRLHHDTEAAAYRVEAALLKAAFNASFYRSATGRYDRGSQTAQAIPLVVGLVPEEQRSAVLANLIADIRVHGNHVTAGDVGFHYVVRALTDAGRNDVLYDMLSRTDPPSYGFQLSRGATTLTEAWNADPGSSQNHFMLGHAEEWFYRGLAGIDLDLSRERNEQIRIAPSVVGSLTSASATINSHVGVISVSWNRSSSTSDTLNLDVTVPPAAVARIVFPPDYSRIITLGGKPLSADRRILRAVFDTPNPHSDVTGGVYHFVLRR